MSIGASRSALVLGVLLFLLIQRMTFGFAVRIAGGSTRAALAQGLPVGRLIVRCCLLAGACAGLAGFFEVAAIHGKANASLRAGLRFHRHPGGVPGPPESVDDHPGRAPVGGIAAAGWLIQRRMDLPDATVLLLQGWCSWSCWRARRLWPRLRVFNPSCRPTGHERSILTVVLAMIGGSIRVRRRSCSSRSANA